MIRLSDEIHCREDFSLLCNWRRLYSGALEVGVDRGEFAQCFLSRWFGTYYVGIDDYNGYEEWKWNRNSDLQIASMRFERFVAKEARIAVGKSIEVMRRLGARDKRFDFIYVDAGHEYEDVKSDVYSALEIASDKAIVAGHDYDETHPGVVRFVDELAVTRDIMLTHETADGKYPGCASWYFYFSGTPGPDWRRLHVE